MAKLSKTAQEFLITGVASEEYGLEIIAAIEAGGGSGGVTSLNSLMGVLNIKAGSNVTVTTSGNSITVSATGGGGGSPGGVSHSIQTNNGSGGFYGDANLTYDGAGNLSYYQGNFNFTGGAQAAFHASVGSFVSYINQQQTDISLWQSFGNPSVFTLAVDPMCGGLVFGVNSGNSFYEYSFASGHALFSPGGHVYLGDWRQSNAGTRFDLDDTISEINMHVQNGVMVQDPSNRVWAAFGLANQSQQLGDLGYNFNRTTFSVADQAQVIAASANIGFFVQGTDTNKWLYAQPSSKLVQIGDVTKAFNQNIFSVNDNTGETNANVSVRFNVLSASGNAWLRIDQQAQQCFVGDYSNAGNRTLAIVDDANQKFNFISNNNFVHQNPSNKRFIESSPQFAFYALGDIDSNNNGNFISVDDGGNTIHLNSYNISVKGAITSYNGDTTTGNGAASVVGNVNSYGNNTALPTTTIFTPVSDGMYRVSGYFETTTGAVSGSEAVNISWTDSIGANSHSLGAIGLTAVVGTLLPSIEIHCKGGQPIQFNTNNIAIVGTPQWNLFLIVERLS